MKTKGIIALLVVVSVVMLLNGIVEHKQIEALEREAAMEGNALSWLFIED